MEDEYLSLGLGKLETEWSKNVIGPQDWSRLFTARDRAMIPYYAYDDEDGPTPQQGWGYKKPLSEVSDRLNLSGYAYQQLPGQLQDFLGSFPDSNGELAKVDCYEFIRLLSAIDISQIDWVEHEGDADYGEFFTRRILTLPAFKPLADLIQPALRLNQMAFEQIDSQLIIAALAHNPANQGVNLEWRDERQALTPLDPYERYLIVTEGPSDGQIISKALELLRPGIADFFEFIDMTANYPFGGAGSLYNFVRGLIKIGTNRKILVIFDNDTEGHVQLNKLLQLTCPPNIKIFALSDMPEFRQFRTVGPLGEALMDVNQQAVAIEMYLDLTFDSAPAPRIRWSSFEKTLGRYQGALENKETYSSAFMSLRQVQGAGYDFTMLRKLLDSLVQTITA
ncbi:MAG: hypothetical protein JWP45_454 [Mucilaginibacter sp.]|nr:hypothetical protein [Mucilaginibacter sp.]